LHCGFVPVAGDESVNAGNQKVEATRLAEEQKKQAEEQKKQAEVTRKTREKAWIAWRDYVEPRCNDSVPMLREGMNVTRFKRHKTNQPVFEGLVVCDRDRVGIVKREPNRMIVTYLVPRFGSSYPLPTSEPPPPEFAPYQSQ
jgi:hypothetical protein